VAFRNSQWVPTSSPRPLWVSLLVSPLDTLYSVPCLFMGLPHLCSTLAQHILLHYFLEWSLFSSSWTRPLVAHHWLTLFHLYALLFFLSQLFVRATWIFFSSTLWVHFIPNIISTIYGSSSMGPFSLRQGNSDFKAHVLNNKTLRRFHDRVLTSHMERVKKRKICSKGTWRINQCHTKLVIEGARLEAII